MASHESIKARVSRPAARKRRQKFEDEDMEVLGVASPKRKREKASISSDEDDEKPTLEKKVKQESEGGEEAGPGATEARGLVAVEITANTILTTPQRTNSDSTHGHFLTFKTTDHKTAKWPLLEEVLSKIPEYASKIAAAKVANRQRPLVVDKLRRDEDRMYDIIDHLDTGAVPSVCTVTHQACLADTTRLASLAGLSLSLGITGLSNSICTRISQQPIPGPATLLSIATKCCAGDSGVDVSSEMRRSRYQGRQCKIRHALGKRRAK